MFGCRRDSRSLISRIAVIGNWEIRNLLFEGEILLLVPIPFGFSSVRRIRPSGYS